MHGVSMYGTGHSYVLLYSPACQIHSSKQQSCLPNTLINATVLRGYLTHCVLLAAQHKLGHAGQHGYQTSVGIMGLLCDL